jgi:hypothetical protein
MQPPCDWQEFHRRAQHCSSVRRKRLNWTPVAITALALVIVVVGVVVWNRIDKSVPATANTAADRGAVDGSGNLVAVNALNLTSRDRPSIAAAQESAARMQSIDAASNTDRAQAIQSWLATLPQEPVVVRVGTRAAVAGLEDRIAQVDDLLTSVRLEGARPDGVVALQQERARLVGSLAQVRYAEVMAAQSP